MRFKLNGDPFVIENNQGCIVSVPYVNTNDTLALDSDVQALNTEVTGLTPFSENDWEDIFNPQPVLQAAIYTENFELDSEYTPDYWAEEAGYGSISELLEDAPDNLGDLGSQRFIPTDESFEYDGEVYEVWDCQTFNGGEYTSTGIYGLLPRSTTLEQLQENSLKTDLSNFYQPFVAKISNDEFYDEPSEGEWILLLAEQL